MPARLLRVHGRARRGRGERRWLLIVRRPPLARQWRIDYGEKYGNNQLQQWPSQWR
jgi:hypothetical protein